MKGKVVVTSPGQPPRTLVETQDVYEGLYEGPTPPAHVSLTVGKAYPFGELKISATVTLGCAQNDKALDRAGELAFFKALKLINEGFECLEAERLG